MRTLRLLFSIASFVCVTTHTLFVCVNGYVWNDWFLRVTRLILMWHASFICVTWLIHMCDYTCLICMCEWNHVRNYWFLRVTRRIHITYEWVMSHIGMSHVTHKNESCHTHKWVMSHILMSHVTHTHPSGQTFEWVTSHVWMSHVTHVNESSHT